MITTSSKNIDLFILYAVYLERKQAKELSDIHFNKLSGCPVFSVLPPQCLRHPNPGAFGTCPHSKILDLPLAPATVLAAAPTSALSLGRRLEVAPATVTCAAAVAPSVAYAGFQPSRLRRPWILVKQTPKVWHCPSS